MNLSAVNEKKKPLPFFKKIVFYACELRKLKLIHVYYELTDLQLSLPEKVSGASWISCSPQSLHDRLSLKLSWQPKRNPRTPVFSHSNLTSSYWAWVRATSNDDDYDDESFNKNIAKMAGNSTPAAKWRQPYKPLIFCLVRLVFSRLTGSLFWLLSFRATEAKSKQTRAVLLWYPNCFIN